MDGKYLFYESKRPLGVVYILAPKSWLDSCQLSRIACLVLLLVVIELFNRLLGTALGLAHQLSILVTSTRLHDLLGKKLVLRDTVIAAIHLCVAHTSRDACVLLVNIDVQVNVADDVGPRNAKALGLCHRRVHRSC